MRVWDKCSWQLLLIVLLLFLLLPLNWLENMVRKYASVTFDYGKPSILFPINTNSSFACLKSQFNWYLIRKSDTTRIDTISFSCPYISLVDDSIWYEFTILKNDADVRSMFSTFDMQNNEISIAFEVSYTEVGGPIWNMEWIDS